MKWVMLVLWALVGAGLLLVALPQLIAIETETGGVLIVEHRGSDCTLVTRPVPNRTSISFVASGGTLALVTAAMNLVAALRPRQRS